MGEGFADMSASLYIQLIEKNPKRFIEFWDDERTMLLERNTMGFRAIDAGPLTMGYRTSNDRTGFDVTRRLIYPKGAYILHMLRMMMWTAQTSDQNFKNMMHDFVKTYAGNAATTEDFKAIVEKHMTPDMQRIGGGKMDWFFDEYVYGTALPTYKLDSSFDKNSDGDVVFSMKMTQSGVDERFRMLVPLYLEFADGRIANFGRVTMVGNTSQEGKISLKGLRHTASCHSQLLRRRARVVQLDWGLREESKGSFGGKKYLKAVRGHRASNPANARSCLRYFRFRPANVSCMHRSSSREINGSRSLRRREGPA